MEEIWETIKGFEKYKVSTFGRVKSLKFGKEKILKESINAHGYLSVGLNGKTKKIHQLVAIAFLGHIPCGHKLVVNHIDINKLNNHVSNLEIVTARENCSLKHLKSASQYVGVYWKKDSSKWKAQIQINGKRKHLGHFTNELEASNAYQNALEKHLITLS